MGRADIVGVADSSDDSAPAAGTVMRGVGQRVRDSRADSIGIRLAIAHAEWDSWVLCQEVSRLQARLGDTSPNAALPRLVPMEQELRVWAPREYDRSIEESEWAQTPVEVRNVWQSRAEALSFAILRRAAVNPDCMRRAMELTSTSERLLLGKEQLEARKSMTLAQLSIKGAFGDDMPEEED